MRRILGFLIILCALPFAVEAADRYAAPTGSGTICSSSNPCSVQEAINQAQSGDTVILKDGTYIQSSNYNSVRSGTANAKITIRAENRHQAVIAPQPSNSTSRRVFNIRHSHIILEGFVIDGGWSKDPTSQDGCCWDGIRHFGTSGSPLVGLITQDIIIRNTNRKPFFNGHTLGAIYRWITVEDTASIAFYLGSFDGSSAAVDTEIYATTIRRTGLECLNPKPASTGLKFHHNICEDVGMYLNGDHRTAWGSQPWGAVIFDGGPDSKNHEIHDNIFRRWRGGGTNIGCLTIFNGGTGHRFHHNVCRDSLSPSSATNSNSGGASNAQVEIDNNTWCDLVNSNHTTAAGWKYRDNNGLPAPNAAGSACDADEARILSEMAHLPGNPNPPTYDNVPPSAPTGLRVNSGNQ